MANKIQLDSDYIEAKFSTLKPRHGRQSSMVSKNGSQKSILNIIRPQSSVKSRQIKNIVDDREYSRSSVKSRS